jgi:nucleoside-diphosphate-sugar epimerase
MNFLVVGHEGYLGSGLFQYFRKSHKVYGWGKKQDISKLSISELKSLGIDVIVNCAVVCDRVSMYYQLDSDSHRVNVEGVCNVLKQIQGSEIKFIQISTKDVFGMVYTETDVQELGTRYALHFFVDDGFPYKPQTIYAKSKMISEIISESYSNSIIIRLSACYTDSYHPKGNWVVRIIKSILTEEPVIVTNKGKQVRDLLHVEDLGRLIEMLVLSEHRGIKINAGGGVKNCFSVLELINMISPQAKIKNEAGDDYGFIYNNRLATDLIKWHPVILFKDRLPNIINSVKKHLMIAR